MSLASIEKRLSEMQEQQFRIEQMLLQLLSPASTLSVNEKAAAIRNALATGNKDILKQTMREINGE